MNNDQVLYQILRAVGHANTILDIAQELYLSQPYISKVLRESERHYQVKLVIRNVHPIMLTAAGQTMLRDLQRIANAKAVMAENVRRSQQADDPRLSVIINNPFVLMHADRILTQYMTLHPELKMNIRFLPTATVAEDLINRICDLSIGPRYNQNELINQPVMSPQLYWLFNSQDPSYVDGETIRPLNHQIFRRMQEYQYIGFTDNSNAQQFIDLALKNFSMPRRFEVPSPQAAVRAVSRMPGATTITTAEIAAAAIPNGQYNLIGLPENYLKLSETVTYLKTADCRVLNLVDYLKVHF